MLIDSTVYYKAIPHFQAKIFLFLTVYNAQEYIRELKRTTKSGKSDLINYAIYPI
jgi:hypothetical protein